MKISHKIITIVKIVNLNSKLNTKNIYFEEVNLKSDNAVETIITQTETSPVCKCYNTLLFFMKKKIFNVCRKTTSGFLPL